MNFKKENVLYIAWIVSLMSMLGSLFFSEVMKFPPCVLCWYQRICMYPLVVILLVSLLKKNKDVAFYVLPLSIIGEVIAVYHNLLYYKLIPESIAPCINGVSCTTQFIQWFGFITIPFLSLTAFTVINICLIIYIRMSVAPKSKK